MKNMSVAIVGGDSLLGREVREVFNQQAPEVEAKLVGSAADSAILTEQDGKPVVITTLDTETLACSQVILVAETTETAGQRFPSVREDLPPAPVIDLTYGLEQEPGAELRAPLVEPPGWQGSSEGTYVIAHPAAIVLATFFEQLHQTHPVRRSVAHVLGPASERGKKGVEELHHQTIQLLSLKSLPQEVFDAQLAFNLLPRYGTEAGEKLSTIEARIRRHLAVLLNRAGVAPAPSLRLTQAPVFHGYSMSVWAELEETAEPVELMKALAGDRIEVRSPEEEPATNAGVTGQSGITVGSVETDPNNPRAAWFWLVADNHRILAENAVCLARLLIPGKGAA